MDNEDLVASPRRGRGRRPAAEVRQEIVRAAGRILLAEGMAGFTIERVAEVAGVSKMTIYKGWPSKGTLALDGYFDVMQPAFAFSDTGDVAADLRTQLHTFVALLRDTAAGRAISELVGAAQTDPELATAFSERYTRPRREPAVIALRRAQDRGQIRPDVDPEVVVDQLWGACYHRLLLPDQPLTDDFVECLLDNLFRGLS
jgi:AcrR family transcriptional regulator